MCKKIIMAIFIIIVSLCSIGCDNNSDRVYGEDNFKITLPDKFISMITDRYDYFYKNKSTIITVIREKISDLKEYKINNDSTTEDYLKIVSNLSDKKYEIVNKKNYSYMIYESNEHYHMASAFKSADSFWIINYMCLKKDEDTYKNEFFKWNDSIVI